MDTFELKDRNGLLHRASKLSMCLKSLLLRNLFKYANNDDNEPIELPSIGTEDLDMILRWIENPDELVINNRNFSDLYVTAEFLIMPELSATIEDWMFSKTNLDKNVVKFLYFAEDFMLSSVHVRARKYILSHLDKIDVQELSRIKHGDLLNILSSDQLRLR